MPPSFSTEPMKPPRSGLLSRPSSSSISSSSTSPLWGSRPSTLSFASLTPSDSPSNDHQPSSSTSTPVLPNRSSPYHARPPQLQALPRLDLHGHRSASSHLPPSPRPQSPFPPGTRPENIDLVKVVEPDVLFQSFTIREIKLIAQRARSDAQHKSQELRQMVGERYRDLLSVADSIVQMQDSSEQLLQKLRQASERCDAETLGPWASQLAPVPDHHNSAQSLAKTSYTLASLVKLIIDLSEHIWRALERNDFLTASRFQVLGRIVMTSLSTGTWDEDGVPQPGKVSETFPILDRQAEALSQLAPQISFSSNSFLRHWEASCEETQAALAALVLLDNASISDSLQSLLRARKWALHSMLASTRGPGSWLDRVENSIRLIITTLTHAQVIFNRGQFIKLLEAVQRGSSQSDGIALQPIISLLPNSHQSMRYMPRSILNFSPFIDALNRPESVDYPSIYKNWFEECKTALVQHVELNLQSTHTSERLVELRRKLEQVMVEQPWIKDEEIKLKDQILNCVVAKFDETYSQRLNQLSNHIIQTIRGEEFGSIDHSKLASWIFAERLPNFTELSSAYQVQVDFTRPQQQSKFLQDFSASIRNRIQGKRGLDHPASIITNLEDVGRSLKSDHRNFYYYGSKTQPEVQSAQDKSRDHAHLEFARNFVGGLLRELNQVLDQKINQADIGRELAIGDVALQICSTRFSFLRDLALIEDEEVAEGEGIELIESFLAGLSAIVSRSCEHWIEAKAKEAVRIFRSRRSAQLQQSPLPMRKGDMAQSSHCYEPSPPVLDLIDHLNQSLIELGPHLIKFKMDWIRSQLVKNVLMSVVLGDNENPGVFCDLNSGYLVGPDGQGKDQAAMDLLVFKALLGGVSGNEGDDRVRQGIEQALEVKDLVEQEDTLRKRWEDYLERVHRIWWMMFKEKGEGMADLGVCDQRDEKKRKMQIPSLGVGKKEEVGNWMGVEVVKPGHRFGLMSIY